MRCVLIADDPLQAEAVCQALRQAGIDARIITENRPEGNLALAICVPPSQEAAARRIVEQGNWPRIA